MAKASSSPGVIAANGADRILCGAGESTDTSRCHRGNRHNGVYRRIHDGRASETLKRALKETLADTLAAQCNLLREIIAEAFEDVALGEAIQADEGTEKISRARVFNSVGERI